jgi:type I restriction enzyme, S subunit
MTGVGKELPIKLTLEELQEVRRILKIQVPEYEVWAFGSRLRSDARKYSDLDIAIITNEPLSLSTMADLVEAFDESDLVFKVDVVDWSTTSESFRNIIKTEKVVVQKGRFI